MAQTETSGQLSQDSETNPLKVAGYWRLLSGSFIATTALWIQRIALSFLVWKLSGSAFWTTAVAAAQFAPSAFLGPLFGVVVDRIALRRSINLALAISTLGYTGSALIFFGGVVEPWAYALVAAWIGIGTAFYAPTRLVLPTVIVPKSALPMAIAFSATSFNLTRVLGPFLGATSIMLFGVGTTLVIALIAYASFWPITLTLTLKERQLPAKTERLGFWQEFRQGLAYIVDHHDLRLFMLLAIMSSVFVRSIAELGPAINGLRFDGQEFTLSLLTLAPALGAIITGAVLGRLASHDALRLRVMLAALAFGPMTGLVAAISGDLAWIFAALLANGLLGSLASVGSQTMLQTRLDDRLRARVMSIWASLALGSIAVASAIYGAIVDWIGIAWTLNCVAVCGGIAGLALFAQQRSKH